MLGISARKTWVSYSGRQPSISGAANTQLAEKLRFFPSVIVDGISYPCIQNQSLKNSLSIKMRVQDGPP